MATTAENPSTQSSPTTGKTATAASTKPTSGKPTGALPKVVGNVPKATPQPSLGQRMLGMLRGSRVSPPPSKQASAKPAATQRKDNFPPGFWRKRMLGMLLLILGMFVILYGLEFLAVSFPQLGLLGSIAPVKANVPVLSGLSYETLILVVLFGGLYILIYRLGLFPNANPPSSTAQKSTGGATTSGSGSATPGPRKPANATPGIGEHRTRADRRLAAERAAERATRAREAKIARENSGMRGMLNRTFKREAAAGTAGTATTKAAKPAKAVAGSASVAKAPTGSAHDEMYERVKADQRQRRRREAKR